MEKKRKSAPPLFHGDQWGADRQGSQQTDMDGPGASPTIGHRNHGRIPLHYARSQVFPTMNSSWLPCVAIVLTLCTTSLAQLPNPTLNQIFPPGAAVGGKQSVTVAGRDLDEGTHLLFSHPGIIGTARTNQPGEFDSKPALVPNQFDVDVSENVPPGRYDVRVVGRFGASTPRSFHVEVNDVGLEAGQNKSAKTAQALPADQPLFGRADANAVDFFRFEAKQGQSVVIDCRTRSIDSKLQPVLTIYDSSGKQLRRSREVVDPIVQFTAPVDGSYVLGLHDHVFAGGADYFYRVELRTQPFIAAVIPSVIEPGQSGSFRLLGTNLPHGQESEFKLGMLPLQQQTIRVYVPPANAANFNSAVGEARSHEQSDFVFQWDSPEGLSNPVRIGRAELPVTIEKGDNNLPTKAQEVQVPTEYVGQFYPRRDQDWVAFRAEKGQRYQIRVISNRLGLATDPEIYVQKVSQNAKGVEQVSQVSTQDDASFDQNRYRLKLPRALDVAHQDPDVSFTADQDGIYRVGVRDLYGGSRDDPRLHYRLQIRPQTQSFQLIAWTQRQAVDNDKKIEAASATLRRGGNLPIYVDAIRRNGMAGAIKLRVEGLPLGVTAETSAIEAAQNHGILMLHATPDAAAWTGAIQIVGEAEIGDQRLERTARAAVLLADTGDVQNSRPRARLTHDFVLAVPADNPAPIVVTMGQRLIETSRGAKVEIPLAYDKATTVKGELSLAAIVDSNEIKPKELKLAPDSKEGKLELALNSEKVPLGTHTFFMRGKVKLDYARNASAIEQAEKDRKDFEQVLAKIASDEKAYSTELETAEKKVADRSEQLKRFNGVQQSANSALAAAVAAAKTAAEQVKLFHAAASASGSDQDLAQIVDQAQAAANQSLGPLNDARSALEQVAKRLSDVQAQAELARKDVTRVKKLRDAVVEKRKRAEAHKQTLDKRVEEQKKNLGVKEVNAWVDSTPITLQIHKSPVTTTLSSSDLTMQPEATAELPVSIARRFGFADSVQIEIALPDTVKGVSVEPLNLPKDQTSGVIKIALPKDVAKGDHRCKIKTKLKFNELNIEDETSLVLHIQ